MVHWCMASVCGIAHLFLKKKKKLLIFFFNIYRTVTLEYELVYEESYIYGDTRTFVW